ncbi:unnamed protein product [Allacma fusca]|uniref:Uncharacterized protein n=1 Tax=Allacma fusca TaxID=39272 RepID=A0A8J2KR19_9HEXA|nr:unnamed protein product [Allacma fusca]
MVLQIVLPEPTNDVNHHRGSCGGGGVAVKNSQDNTEPWLRRSGSVNSLTESRIGDDSLFSYGYAHLRSGLVRDDLKQHVAGLYPYPESASPVTASNARTEAPPTTKEDKKSMFKGYLTVILSCIYAIFILMLGVVVYIADLISRTATMAEVFSVYLVILGLLWLIFLYCDIRRHQGVMRKERSRSEGNIWSEGKSASNKDENCKRASSSSPSTEEADMGSDDTISHVSIPVTPRSVESKTYNTSSYTFCRSRHSGSFYLKIGAAGFCFGHLIHSGLLLCRQIIFFTTEDQKVFDRCANVTNLILEVLFPIYSFLLLFVIFKYSNVIINRHQELSRFALMHCISSSLCFWFWSILRETADSLYHKMIEHNNSHNNHHHQGSSHHSAESLESLIALPLTSYNEEERSDVFDFLNATAITSFYDPCVEFSPISELVLKMSPYLYPFSIEYSILVVGVLFIMWQNIGKGEESRRRRRFRLQSINSHEDDFPPTSFNNHLIIHADCHSANKGLFAGLLVLVGTVVSVIIFYIALDDSSSGFAAQWVNLTSQAGLLVLMIITVLVAYRQITKLDVNMHPVSLLDDLLLFFCLPSFFLYTIFTVVPAMAHQDYFAIVVCTLQVIQVILQTPCIIDGLRRCSNTEKLRQEKPGRELITFLIVCNIAMWVIETFEIKSAYAQHEQISFYGSILWTLLSHMTLPLTLFYRFHSSVCLVDIWKSAYEAGD